MFLICKLVQHWETVRRVVCCESEQTLIYDTNLHFSFFLTSRIFSWFLHFVSSFCLDFLCLFFLFLFCNVISISYQKLSTHKYCTKWMYETGVVYEIRQPTFRLKNFEWIGSFCLFVSLSVIVWSNIICSMHSIFRWSHTHSRNIVSLVKQLILPLEIVWIGLLACWRYPFFHFSLLKILE